MPKNRAVSRARIAKGAIATVAVGALAISGLALGSAVATATSPSTTVYVPSIGLETNAGYPASPWFFGLNNNAAPTASVDGNGSLVVSGGAQLLHQFPGISTFNETDGALDAFLAADPSFTVEAGTDGTASYQLAMIVGPAKTWTTLRTADDIGAGENDVADYPQWESSSNIGTITKNTPYDLDDLVAAIDAVGPQQLFAFGIQATVATGNTAITSISGAGDTYTFAEDVTVSTADSQQTVFAPNIGREDVPVHGYPTNAWFYGDKGGSNDPTTSAVDDNGDLVLSSGTQLLHQFPGLATATPTADALDSFFESGVNWTTTGDGTSSFQLPLVYGPAGKFVTLYAGDGGDLPAGSHDVSLADLWQPSQDIKNGSTTVIAKNTVLPLGQLIAAIDAIGPQELLAFGVEGTVGTTPGVASIQAEGTKYTFGSDVSVPAPTSHVLVQSGAIGLETEDGYPASPWFFGHNADTSPSASIVGGNLELTSGTLDGTQLLHQFTDLTRPASLRAFIEDGANYTLTGTGTASFQLPLVYGPAGSTHFTTLRTASDLGAGSHDVLYGDEWTSSHDIGTTVTAGHTYTLAQLVTAIEAAGGPQVLSGFGVQVTTGTSADLVSIQAEGTEYTFADTKTLTLSGVTVTGTAKVGQVLGVTFGLSSPNNATYKYQWRRDGAAISKATGATYTVTSSDYKHKLSVTVSASKPTYVTATQTSAPTAAVGPGVIAISAAATVSGTAAVGNKLSAHIATAPSATYAYQWLANGTAIKSATSSTYVIAAADVNKKISVKVTASKSYYGNATSTSSETAAVVLGTLTISKPTLSGSATVGKSVIATVSATSGALLRYSFFADGTLVQLSTSRTMLVTWDLKGTRITVSVTGTKTGYNTLTSALSGSSGLVK